MQPLTKHREVSSGGVTESVRFGISFKNQEHIKMLLRDAIYSDKVLAVLREYSANAWDAHRVSGKADLPIRVRLPTWHDPVLLIEDSGPGLSHDEAFNVFTQYGDSTKRDSNDAVGMLGIGSKSGFAYSDTFTVTSRHGGKKRTYVAVLDEDDNDLFNLLSEEDHDPADTGLSIQIAVRKEDVAEFHKKAMGLFQYFQPRPTINIPLPEMPKIAAKLKHGLIYDKTNDYWEEKRWFAVMGCIPYRIDLDQLKGPDGSSLISENFSETSGLLYFGIGDVQINASREALKYSKVTKEALVAKFESLLEEYVKVVLDEAESTGNTEWGKRVILQRLLALGLGKKEIGDFAEESVHFGHTDELEIEGSSILVAEDSRFVRFTEEGVKRDIKGYNLRYRKDVLVRPAVAHEKGADGHATYKVDDARYPDAAAWAALERLIQAKKMTGVTVTDLHELPWTQPWVQPKKKRSSSKEYNPKHHATVFRFLGVKSHDKCSENWEPVSRRKPQPDDVFVVIKQFVVQEGGGLYSDRSTDERIAAHFGLKLPEVYGYKNTDKKPVTAADVPGITYSAWRKKFLDTLPADKLEALVQAHHWGEVADYYSMMFSKRRPQAQLARVWDELGGSHPVTRYLYAAYKTKTDPMTHNLYHKLQALGAIKGEKPEASELLGRIRGAYPLLADAGLKALWKDNAAEWRRYIRLVDGEKSAPLNTYADIAVPPEAPTEE